MAHHPVTDPLEIRIVIDAPVPVYRQIADAVRLFCVNGRLAPGAKLPTVRELAANLGVHHNTVAQAYRTLEDEGWLRIAGRNGVVVADRQQPAAPIGTERANEASRLRHLIAELRAKGFTKEWIGREVTSALETTR